MYFLTFRNARLFACFYGCVSIYYGVKQLVGSVRDYLLLGIKVFSQFSRSLDGISRYVSVNFL